MPSEGELHSWNRWQMGNMECGCSKYYVEVMGGDHDCYVDEEPAKPEKKVEPFKPTKRVPF